MRIRRRIQSPPEDANHILLSTLLAEPPPEARLRPVSLRSVADQRRTVLAPYPLRTWLDYALARAERLLSIVVIVFFGWWLFDGYGRDWWHARYGVPPVAAAPTQIAQATPVVVQAAHPELGVSLPVVDEPKHRPSITFDYIVPARTYIAPLKPTPIPPALPPADLRPAVLVVPAIRLDAKVIEVFVQDGAWQVADYAVGYHHGTGVAGSGNMVLAGHKGIRGAVFAYLEQLKPGNDIFVDAAGQRFQYRVRAVGNVWPNQVDVMFPTEQPQLTLLTCTNWDTQRFIVIADLIGAAPSPAAAGGN